MKHDHVLSNVSFEHVRGPTSGPSNELAWSASFCECGGTTHMHGLTCDLGGAERTQVMDEPGVCGHSAVAAKEQLWVQGEQAIV